MADMGRMIQGPSDGTGLPTWALVEWERCDYLRALDAQAGRAPYFTTAGGARMKDMLHHDYLCRIRHGAA